MGLGLGWGFGWRGLLRRVRVDGVIIVGAPGDSRCRLHLDRHALRARDDGGEGVRDDDYAVIASEARQSSHPVIARRQSRRGNPEVLPSRPATHPPWIAKPFGLAMTVEGAGEMQGVSWGVGNFYSLAGPY